MSLTCLHVTLKPWILPTLFLIILIRGTIHAMAADNTSQPRIVIVGAGVSGIAAVSRLIENGFNNIKVLEAENRIGGRVHSVKTGNWTVDMGGHWVHGESGNVVYEIAAPLGLLDNDTRDYTNEITVFSDKTEGESVHFPLAMEDDSRKGKDRSLVEGRRESVYDLMQKRLVPMYKNEFSDQEKADAYLNWTLQILCTWEGCDSLKDVSTEGEQYIESPGSQGTGWKGKGYKSIIDLLLKRHAKSSGPPIDLEDKLHLNTEVISMRQGSDGVSVLTSNGTTFTADVVIVTVSVAVLKDRQHTMFHPPLPHYKKNAIEGLGIGTVDKIILRFPFVWWPENITGFELVWLDKDKSHQEGKFQWEESILSFETEEGSPLTLTAWMVGEAARSMESHSLEDVKNGAMRILKRFLGHKYSIPEPVEVLRSCWGTNPHFRGSYSYPSVAAHRMNISRADLESPLTDHNGKEVILFAGEATNRKHFSTVHGALEAGWREADRIINKYKS